MKVSDLPKLFIAAVLTWLMSAQESAFAIPVITGGSGGSGGASASLMGNGGNGGNGGAGSDGGNGGNGGSGGVGSPLTGLGWH
jgi:hypothetical protein